MKLLKNRYIFSFVGAFSIAIFAIAGSLIISILCAILFFGPSGGIMAFAFMIPLWFVFFIIGVWKYMSVSKKVFGPEMAGWLMVLLIVWIIIIVYPLIIYPLIKGF